MSALLSLYHARASPVLFRAAASAEGKPSPQPVRELLRRLQVEPSDCLLLEDSEAGVWSGLRAGVPVIWLGGNAEARAQLQAHSAEVWPHDDLSSFLPHQYGFPSFESSSFCVVKRPNLKD